MNIVGVSALFHDSACCLLQDGKLVAAAQEERFSRVKEDPRFPVRAFRYCLDAGGLDIVDIDCVAYYESPVKKLSRQLWMDLPHSADPALGWLDGCRPEREIRESLGFDGPVDYFDHHLSHAAASYYYSGFDHAAVLTADAVGEWATTTYAAGRGPDLRILDEVRFPDSVGLFYSTVTQYLGFKVLSDEYKVMGLAPYGRPRYVRHMWELIRFDADGKFRLTPQFFRFDGHGRMYTQALVELMGSPPRKPESDITEFHQDVARSLQVVLEEVLLAQVKHLRRLTTAPDLCLSGGVALNCVANGRLRREGGFDRLFVQPAAGDAGSALGAAALSHVKRTGGWHPRESLPHVYLGPSYTADDVAEVLRATDIAASDFRGRLDDLLEAVVDRLVAGKVVAWFQGRMEFGPRALGGRSILADPRLADMRDRLNALVKKREAFRPFAPAIREEVAGEHLALDHPSRFMLETCQVTSGLPLPAVTHVDGSCRPQTVSADTNPRFARLLAAFAARTGCPMLVNTSFNVRGEPIVCSPADALRCFAGSGIDCLVIEDWVVDRDRLGDQLAAAARLMAQPLLPVGGSAEDVDAAYTFI